MEPEEALEQVRSTWTKLQELLWSTDLQLPPSFDRWLRGRIDDLDDAIEEIARFNMGERNRTVEEITR